MRLMRPLADQGHVTAQTVVGLMYYFNYGGDYVSAYMWFRLAAAQGNAFAEMFLKDTAGKMTRDADSPGGGARARVESDYAAATVVTLRTAQDANCGFMIFNLIDQPGRGGT